MNFWERVDALLEQNDINRKTLATAADFDPSNIGKGKKNGNIPNADTAVKIAQFLHTSVEHLVTGKKSRFQVLVDENDARLVRKYAHILRKLEFMPSNEQIAICEMIEKI